MQTSSELGLFLGYMYFHLQTMIGIVHWILSTFTLDIFGMTSRALESVDTWRLHATFHKMQDLDVYTYFDLQTSTYWVKLAKTGIRLVLIPNDAKKFQIQNGPFPIHCISCHC